MSTRGWKRGMALLFSAVLAGSTAAAQSRDGMTPAKVTALAARINPQGYTGHEVCAACHQDISDAWKDSAHARAVSDPAFRQGLSDSVAKHGEGTKKLCLACHAPTTRVTRATSLNDPLVAEGVSCDFCHTVKAVDMSRPDEPFEMAPGPVKYGPFEYAPSPAHPTAFSLLHRNKPT